MLVSLLLMMWIGVVLLGMWTSRLYRTRQEIRDADDSIYLIRYFLWKPDWLNKIGIDAKKAGRIYLHHIIRDDYQRAVHSHPWPFLSLMLRGSYREVAPTVDVIKFKPNGNWGVTQDSEYSYADFNAPCILRRRPEWRHRLGLLTNSCWTLVFVGPKTNEWGFFPSLNKFCPWRKFNYKENICEETTSK